MAMVPYCLMGPSSPVPKCELCHRVTLRRGETSGHALHIVHMARAKQLVSRLSFVRRLSLELLPALPLPVCVCVCVCVSVCVCACMLMTLWLSSRPLALL